MGWCAQQQTQAVALVVEHELAVGLVGNVQVGDGVKPVLHVDLQALAATDARRLQPGLVALEGFNGVREASGPARRAEDARHRARSQV
jgi:hypothetical protein